MLRPYRAQWPTVHPSAYVDASAQVIGDVTIGDESSVWMNVVLRGDVHHIRIGRRSAFGGGAVSLTCALSPRLFRKRMAQRSRIWMATV